MIALPSLEVPKRFIAGFASAAWVRLIVRIEEAKDTAALEIALWVLSVFVSSFNIFFPGGYKEGWSFIGIFVDQQQFGWVGFGLSCLLFSAIAHGGIRFRISVSYFAMFLNCGVGTMIWLGNHVSPVLPFHIACVLFRLYIIGRLAKLEARRGPS